MQFKRALLFAIANFQLIVWCRAVVAMFNLNFFAHVSTNKIGSIWMWHVIGYSRKTDTHLQPKNKLKQINK